MKSVGVTDEVSKDRGLEANAETRQVVEAESEDEEVPQVADEEQISLQVHQLPRCPTMSIYEVGEA